MREYTRQEQEAAAVAAKLIAAEGRTWARAFRDAQRSVGIRKARAQGSAPTPISLRVRFAGGLHSLRLMNIRRCSRPNGMLHSTLCAASRNSTAA